MASRWWIVLYPLAAPTGLALLGALTSYFAVVKRSHSEVIPRTTAVRAVGVTAIAAALVPNAGQQLYDLGMTFPAIELIQTASYFVFGSAIIAGWHILHTSWKRWLFAPLVPVSFAQPALWTLVYIGWNIHGFAP